MMARGRNIFLRKQRGQGLIEALIIFLLIGIGITGIIKGQNFLLYRSRIINQQGEALILATQQLEVLEDFQTINPASDYTAYSNITSSNTTVNRNGTIYTVTWNVTTNTNPNYKILDVSVQWPDSSTSANNQAVRLITRIARIDPSYSATLY